MADVTLICAACGKNVKVSEFVEGPVTCPQCGQPLKKIEHTPPPAQLRPQLASMAGRASLVSPEIPPELPTAAAHPLGVPSRRRDHEAVRIRTERYLRLHYLFAWFLFVVLLALLLAWQWQGLQNPHLLNAYLAARWWLALFAWLIVVLPAFLDSWLQGVLCLLVPPYSVYFALNRMDVFQLRAIFFAVVLALAAEYYFLPDRVLFNIVQEQMATWVVDVRSLIQHAGSSSVLH